MCAADLYVDMVDTEGTEGEFILRLEAAIAKARLAVEDACATESLWQAKVAAAIEASLRLAKDDPDVARTIVLESLVRGEEAMRLRREFWLSLAAALGRERPRRELSENLPASTEQLLIGAVMGLIGQHLNGETDWRPEDLAPDLIELTLLPYLGPAESRAWASRARRGGGAE